LGFLLENVVTHEEVCVPFNRSASQELLGVGAFDPEIDRYAQSEFCGREHVALEGACLCAVDRSDRSDDDGVGFSSPVTS
jgi:hypothetical protein